MARYSFGSDVAITTVSRPVYETRRRGIWPFRRDVHVYVGEEAILEPVPGAKITVWDKPEMGTMLAQHVTDENGWFDLGSLEAPQVWVTADGGERTKVVAASTDHTTRPA